MQKLPKVAVIVANRNYGQWLYGCLESVDKQVYGRFINEIQVFLADDGSTDDSVHIAHKFKSENEFLVVNIIECDTNPVVAERIGKGPSYARNKAIKVALDTLDPDVFIMLDADDEFGQEKVWVSVREWQKSPDLIGVVYGDYIIHNEGSGFDKIELKEPFDYGRLLQENIVHSCSLVSKKALLECGLYDESLRTCEDYDLWCRIAQKYSIVHVPQVLMKVRTTGQNSTFSVPLETWRANLQTVRDRYVKRIHSQN